MLLSYTLFHPIWIIDVAIDSVMILTSRCHGQANGVDIDHLIPSWIDSHSSTKYYRLARLDKLDSIVEVRIDDIDLRKLDARRKCYLVQCANGTKRARGSLSKIEPSINF